MVTARRREAFSSSSEVVASSGLALKLMLSPEFTSPPARVPASFENSNENTEPLSEGRSRSRTKRGKDGEASPRRNRAGLKKTPQRRIEDPGEESARSKGDETRIGEVMNPG